MEQFTQHETVILTHTSPGRLAYLAKTGIVVPVCLQDSPCRQLYYSWEQILELRTICQLRRQISLQMIRKILAFLENNGSDRTLHNKQLIVANGAVDWIQLDMNKDSQIVRVAAKTNQHVGQLKLITMPLMSDLVHDVWGVARQSNVIDFEGFRCRASLCHQE